MKPSNPYTTFGTVVAPTNAREKYKRRAMIARLVMKRKGKKK